MTIATPPAVLAPSVAIELLDLLWAQVCDNKDGSLGDPKDSYRTLRAGLAAHALDTTAVVTHEQAHPAATPSAVLARLDALIAILADGRTTTDSGLPVTALELIDVQQAAAKELRELRASLAQQGEGKPLAWISAAQLASLHAWPQMDRTLRQARLRATKYADSTVPLFTRPAAVDAAMVERVAIGLWHRFAPDSHIEWADETHKAEYLHAARDLLTAALLPATSEGGDNV